MHLCAELTYCSILDVGTIWRSCAGGKLVLICHLDGAILSLQLSSRALFAKIEYKKVITENQSKKHKKKLSFVLSVWSLLGNFSWFFVLCWFFFSKSTFSKILTGIPLKCQTVCIQIWPDVFFGLIWVQTVCKGYQQKIIAGSQLRAIRSW